MRHKMTFALAVIAATLCVSHSSCDAQTLLNAGSITFDARADQTITLEDTMLTGTNAPFDGLAGIPLGITATGSVTIEWDEGVIDGSGDQSAVMSNYSAFFAGTLPTAQGLRDYTLVGEGSILGAFTPSSSGNLSNVVADADGELLSAFWTLNTTFVLAIENVGTIYTPTEAVFTGGLLSDGSNTGQVFSSPEAVNGNAFTGGDGSNDFLAAVSTNRTVTVINAVPEPGSLTFVCLAAIGVLVNRRR